MLLYIEDDVQIAGRTAIRAGFPFPLDTETCSGVYAGRTAQLDRSFLLDAALAAALRAALLDNLTGTLAGGAGARNREESLLIGELPAACTSLTSHYAGSSFGARAVTSGAKLLARD